MILPQPENQHLDLIIPLPPVLHKVDGPAWDTMGQKAEAGQVREQVENWPDFLTTSLHSAQGQALVPGSCF